MSYSRSPSFSPEAASSPAAGPSSHAGRRPTSRRPSAAMKDPGFTLSDDEDDESDEFTFAGTVLSSRGGRGRGRGGGRGSRGGSGKRKSTGRAVEEFEPQNKYKDKFMALKDKYDEVNTLNHERSAALAEARAQINKVQLENDVYLEHFLNNLHDHPTLAYFLERTRTPPPEDGRSGSTSQNGKGGGQDPAVGLLLGLSTNGASARVRPSNGSHQQGHDDSEDEDEHEERPPVVMEQHPAKRRKLDEVAERAQLS